MTTYTRQLLSGSTNGRVIPVAAVATPGTLIHTATAVANAFDEVYLWANNTDTVERTLTIEWGGVLDPGDHITKAVRIPPSSPPIPIVTGKVLNGGLVVRAFASVASVINLSGYVNRIAP